MPIDVALPVGRLFGFLLALARVSGVFAFLPIPGGQNAPPAARVVCALGFTLLLEARWPSPPASHPGLGTILWWVLNEAAVGATLGLVVLLLGEAFTIGAQIVSMQAGYSYATTIDPTSQVDASLLPLVWQLFVGLLFFSTGIDGYLIRALADSLSQCPPGQCSLVGGSATEIIGLGQQMLALGFRIALPVLTLLFLVDLALAFVSRVSAQLQLLSLAFPAKLLGSLFLLALLVPSVPNLYRAAAEQVMPVLSRLVR